MKLRTTHLKTIVLSIFFLSFLLNQAPAQTVLIDPAVQYQEIEGWGGSLCWWANIMGGYSDTDVLKICDWITDPDGLNMNIFRFNIGGGDDPEHNHMRGDGGAMPGYKASADGPYDWTQDENQRRILQQLIASRVEQAGENDIILEAFSNSPPYWMTVSGCSAGSVEGNVPNLRSDMYDDFADYLTEVVKYYHDELGITFDYLEPFNEPFSTWWKAFGGQEGCYFGQEEQEKMIRELYAALQEKNMLDYCTITAMDANSLDETYNGVVGYINEGDILPKLSKISGHSYFGSKNSRKNLAKICYDHDIELWQSESGPLNMGGTSNELILAMAARIVKDIKEMRTPAWIDWQLAANNSPQWGILVGKYEDPTNPVTKGYGYYIRSQFSRFIPVGYRIIDVKDEKTLAAMNAEGTELVFVVVNETDSETEHSYDLGAFNITGEAKRYRTREVNPSYTEKVFQSSVTIEQDIFDYTALPFSVTTFVVPVELPSTQITEGRYYIRNKAGEVYVGIANGSENPGAKLVVTGETATEHSAFEITPDEFNGGFIMKPGHLDAGSSYVLDVQGITNDDRAQIIQYADWGGENQRFHFVPLDDHTYKIIIRRSMKCWSLPDDVFETGEPVLQMAWDEEDHSVWEILKNPVFLQKYLEAEMLNVSYSSGMLQVQMNDSKIMKDVSVLDLLGKILRHESNIYASRHRMHLDVDPGIYLVRATLSDGIMANEMFYKP